MSNGNSRRQKQGGVSALLMLLAASFYGSSASAAGPTLHFDIPAGDSVKSLSLFNTQSRIEMLYLADQVQGRVTHAVSGDFEIVDALRMLLEGTDLEFEFKDDYSFVYIKPKPRPDEIGPATPMGIQAQAMPPNARHNLFEIADTLGEHNLQEVTITGTLMHGVLDIMSPLSVVTRKRLKQTAYGTVQDAIQTLPLNLGGGPSEDAGGVGNFARGVAVNLRGLGAGATLVLVDGHRQPFSGTQGDFVDVSNIPWTAVERIEVLPDGASATYGSDAVAGVVNVIMRDDFVGAETLARLGTAPGGAKEKLIGQLFGTRWSSGKALLSYQYAERTALAAAERRYAASADKTSLGGSDFRTFRSSPGNILDPFTQLPSYAIPSAQDGTLLTASDLIPGAVNLLNRYSTVQLLPEKRTHSVFFTASQEISDRVSLFAEGRASQRDMRQELYGFDTVLLVPTSNPYAAAVNPYSGVPFVLVGYNFLNDFGPIDLSARSRVYSGTFGLKAVAGETWRMTLSGSYGREATSYGVHNQPDPTALGAALADSDPRTAFNPFGIGTHNNPATLDAIRLVQNDRAASTVSGATAVADGELIDLPAGAARLAFGTEWRKEQFELTLLKKHGAFDRTVKSAFAELSVPIIGNPADPHAAPRLELSLAGRYESYSDFGTTANPRLGLRWAPTSSIKLRTSWGTSFRAPKLVDVYDTSGNLALLAGFRDPSSPTGNSVVLARLGNNEELKEETATTWTGGIDFAPASAPGFTASLTYYAIDYEHRIAVPGAPSLLEILMHEDQWGSVIERNPSSAAINAICDSPVFSGSVSQCKNTPVSAIIDFRVRNLAATKVRGLDLRMDEVLKTRYGRFNLGLDGGYIFRFGQADSDSSPMVNIVNTVSNPLALRLRSTIEWYERNWDQPGFGASLALDHTGAYHDSALGDGRDVNGLTTLDFRVSYRTPAGISSLSDVEFGLNAINVFDRAPPFVNQEVGYDQQNGEPYGRVISISIQKDW